MKNIEINSTMKLSKTIPVNANVVFKKEKAFTLAEVLITLSILGVVAAITIPSLVRTQSEIANRTKIKKAMAAYESMISRISIEEDIHNNSALRDFLCSSTYTLNNDLGKYLKISEKQNVEMSRINTGSDLVKTADGVWYDFCSDMSANPVNTYVALNKKDLSGGYYSVSDADSPAFKFSFTFSNDGALHINDGTALDTDAKNRLYNFVDGKLKVDWNKNND